MHEVAAGAHHPLHPPPRSLRFGSRSAIRGRLHCAGPVSGFGPHRGTRRRVAPLRRSVAKFLRVEKLPIVDAGADRGGRACGCQGTAVAPGGVRGSPVPGMRGSSGGASVVGAPADHPGPRLEAAGRDAEAFRGAVEQFVARGEGGGPDLGASALHRSAAGGKAVVGSGRGVAVAHADTVRVQGQFLAADQGERIAQPLAELHLAGQYGDGPVGLEPQPFRDAAGHGAGSCAAAAASVARIIRLWAPQRQMLRSSAVWICSRVGAGSRSNRAAAAIITPLAQ